MSDRIDAPAVLRIYLRTFEDWADWDRAFRTKANSAKIWHLINPDRDDQPYEEPVRPTFSTYFRRIPPQRIEPDLPRQTRQSDSQGSQTATPTYTLETIDPTVRAQSITELTAEDRAAYQSDRKDYEQDYRQFEQQHRWIDKIKNWVMESVAKSLVASSCDPEQDLRQWYSNLRDSVGASTTEQQNEALAKYQKILSAVPKASKDFPNWLTEWEQATHQAQTRGIGGLDNPNVWFNNLCQAIEPVLSNWVSNFQGIYQDKLEDKTLAIRTVAKNLRTEVSRRGLQQPARNPPARHKRDGAFGPTFDEGLDQGQDPDKEGKPAGPSQARQDKKRKSDQAGPSTKKNKSKDNRDQDDIPSCEACGGPWHTWVKCHYVFPSKAPATFRPRALTQDAVKYRLSLPEWKDKLKALKEAAGPARSD